MKSLLSNNEGHFSIQSLVKDWVKRKSEKKRGTYFKGALEILSSSTNGIL